MYLQVQTLALFDFVLAPGGIEAVRYYWSILQTMEPNSGKHVNLGDPTIELILIQALKLLKNLILDPASVTLVSNAPSSDPKRAAAISKLDTELFTSNFMPIVCRVLIEKFLVISEEDYSMWQDDPEGFILEEGADHWEYHLRVDDF